MPIVLPKKAEVLEAQQAFAEVKDAQVRDNHLFALFFTGDEPLVRREYPKWIRDPKTGRIARDSEGNPIARGVRRLPLRRRQWIERYCQIKPKKGGSLHALVANAPQRRLEAWIIRQERAGVPVRIIILKARQMGFCCAPSTRVLTADLRWVTADAIPVGTEIVAVDENVPGGRGNGRKMRTGVVQAKREVFEPAYRIRMSNGETLTLTAQHRMLCRRRSGTEMEWRAVADMHVDDEIRFVTKPWDEPTVEDGWFGGILDGEGSFASEGSVSVNATQRPGPVWDRMQSYLAASGYNFCVEDDATPRRTKFGKTPVPKVVLGRMNEVFRVIGQTRPTRFIARRWWEGRDLPGKKTGESAACILSIESVGAQRMIDLQTSTQTFIAEGFVSHNSTWVMAVDFHGTMCRSLTSALLVAQDDQTATKVLDMAHTMRDNVPLATRVFNFKMRHDAADKLRWETPLTGVIEIASAQKKQPGRGFTGQLMHLSEAAFWVDATLKANALLQAMPEEGGTVCIVESTAQGDTGWFRDMFYLGWTERADPIHSRTTGWHSIFFPWFEHPDYYWTKTFGSGRPLPHELVLDIKLSLTLEEEWLLKQTFTQRWSTDNEWTFEEKYDYPTDSFYKHWKRVGVGPRKVGYDQLAWRRRQIRDKSNGDPLKPGTWDKFNEEYPSRPEVAFLSTGRLIFDVTTIQERRTKCREPVFVGELVDTGLNWAGIGIHAERDEGGEHL